VPVLLLESSVPPLAFDFVHAGDVPSDDLPSDIASCAVATSGGTVSIVVVAVATEALSLELSGEVPVSPA